MATIRWYLRFYCWPMQIYWSRGECNKAWQRKVAVSPGPSHKTDAPAPTQVVWVPKSTCTIQQPTLLSWGFKLEQNKPTTKMRHNSKKIGQRTTKAVKAVYANGLTCGLEYAYFAYEEGRPFWAGTINKACNFSNLSREQWHKQLEDNENHPHKQVHYSSHRMGLVHMYMIIWANLWISSKIHEGDQS